jgi:polyvinyl alcohol dehydrogenase (cytochrome)
MDTATGKVLWKSYTVPEEPKPTKKNSGGVQLWAPAGAAVWSAPTLDLKAKAVYVGTGNSYTEPAVDTSDSVIAFDMETGKMLWASQVLPKDAFVIGCRAGNENCPTEVGPDFDFGNSPILRNLPGGKRILVIGQKSGVLWGLDPDNRGKVLWQYRAGKGGALGGIEWGSAADETQAYAPVSDRHLPADAGGLHAVKLTTGERVWYTPPAKLNCTPSGGMGRGNGCNAAQSAAIAVMPGVVFSGSVDGHLRAYSTKDGSVIWDYDAMHDYETVNKVKASGGSFDAAGPAIIGGMVFTGSGYGTWGGRPGNVLLAFSPQ